MQLMRVMAAAAAAAVASVASVARELAVLSAIGSLYVSKKKKQQALYILMADFLQQRRTVCIAYWHISVTPS